jgi:hypothetical protein
MKNTKKRKRLNAGIIIRNQCVAGEFESTNGASTCFGLFNGDTFLMADRCCRQPCTVGMEGLNSKNSEQYCDQQCCAGFLEICILECLHRRECKVFLLNATILQLLFVFSFPDGGRF